MSGRPIRFLGGVLALWALGRMAFLLPGEGALEEVERVTVAAPARGTEAAVRSAASIPLATPRPPKRTAVVRPKSVTKAGGDPPRPITPPATMTIPVPPSSTESPLPVAPIVPAWRDTPASPDRWSLGIWAVARQGVGTLTPGGQLGGSQAGLRLLRRLDSHGALSAAVRLSAPANGPGREMGLGLDWQPVRHIPVRLLVERRVALDRGRGGTALLAVTGIGPRPVAAGWTLTAYAQGGVVLRERDEPFADGAVRMTVPLTRAIDLGAGLWGGAQREAQRLDIGPTLGIAVPVADRRVRLSLDWRQRVAGRAAPDSGPALTLAGDF